ncbi:putative vacuolar iron transporter protein [Podospora fimiseda]|uniref:Vacuolar iron transporter protein n=1 Tax=Podospora fimiseda TaxID=252190 RepID=A0AAN7GZA7_9PEZI|nr:putative vacuolar iron transporter protein [Podospora fimiseda]
MAQPSYSTIPNPPPTASTSSDERLPLLTKNNIDPQPRDRSPSPSSSTSSLTIPSTTRFLADFTLGFADGLTVPFALTAGLSSLGKTDTVIYAGMAEICAGSISMGIGGYLSAKGEYNLSLQEEQEEVQSDEETVIAVPEEQETSVDSAVEKYLAPLELEEDEEMRKVVEGWVRKRPGVIKRIMRQMDGKDAEGSDKSSSTGGGGTETRVSSSPPAPLLVGISVSLGYLLGGLLPLFPYFFVAKVGDGLKWSFVVCLLALFLFGFLKDFFLSRQQQSENLWRKEGGRKKRVSWRDVRRSMWEGTQMALMGGVAAVAAVLCVKAFEGLGV